MSTTFLLPTLNLFLVVYAVCRAMYKHAQNYRTKITDYEKISHHELEDIYYAQNIDYKFVRHTFWNFQLSRRPSIERTIFASTLESAHQTYHGTRRDRDYKGWDSVLGQIRDRRIETGDDQSSRISFRWIILFAHLPLPWNLQNTSQP